MKKIKWCLGMAGAALTAGALMQSVKNTKEDMTALKKASDKCTDNYNLLMHWLEIKNAGGSVASYFKDMGYKEVAVYGMWDLANRLIEDAESGGIRIVYGIDRDAACCISQLANVYSPEDELPEADVIVVTPFYAFDDIKNLLEKKVKCPIISLEDVVWSV